MGALRRHLIWVVIPLLVAAVILPATAQDTGTTADDPFVFFTPGLALTDRDTSHDKFFNSIDTTLVIPFGPNVSAMGTYSLQFKDTPRWTAVGNYDWFATDDLTVRAAGGIFSDEFGARLTAYKPGRKFGTGVRAGVVSGDLEVGGFLTTPFTWGFPLRKQRMGDRINGRMRVADLGASTAVAVSIRGGELDIGTEPEYFYPRNEDWARFAQGAQGTAATQTALAPRLHQVWSTRTGAAIRSSAAIADSTAYVGSDDGYFYALNLDTGELRWRYWLGSPVASSPAVEGGRVVVGCDDGSVYCFSRTADKQLSEERVGEQIWRFRTKGAVVGSPLITVSGLAIFGSRDGSLYAVDTRTAKLKWQ
ncbi:MAG TPA: PQQ-binding-like beta-propeller repeat protein, partial [Armatimonadota bacterium]|nr:PQQ-binding-like beta-propeller repeat protein [Armatimonadota bacterium]